ncbi:MAG: hypothetical protein EOO77_33270 [Oxalobacteraceae bacterium]|nr:MAG: hypothetical protein EOO77_33270 [Oxalobacteraceae bacterium]
MLDHLRAIAAFRDKLESGRFDAGHWVEPVDQADGSMVMGYFHMGADMLAFMSAAGPLMVKGFDWPSWIHADGARVRDEIETATQDELRQVIHALVRQERFVEGLLNSAYEDGTLLRITKRAGQLVDAAGVPQQGWVA